MVGVQQYLVRPIGQFDNDKPTGEISPTSTPAAIECAGSPTQQQTTAIVPVIPQPEHGITESLLKIAGRPLNEIIHKVSFIYIMYT